MLAALPAHVTPIDPPPVSAAAENEHDSSIGVGMVESAGSPNESQPHNPLLVSSISQDEPIVTRRELWSYYCACLSLNVAFVDGQRR